MYLYSRGFRIVRNVEESRKGYGEILGLLNDNSGIEMHCWASAFSPAPNTLVFTTMIESRQAVMDAFQKMATVPEYAGLVDSLRPNVTPPVDAFRLVLNAEKLDMTAGPKPVANVTSAQIVGDIGKAFDWALEMADFSGGLTNPEVAVTVNTVGPVGQINWMAGVDDMDAVDAAEMALWSDPGYMERMSQARASGFFGPGPGATGASVFVKV